MSVHKILLCAIVLGAAACGQRSSPEPVDLYPEDQCAACRMSIADRSFASEIIDADGSVSKFDDFGCFERFRKTHPDLTIEAAFLVDFDSKEWIDYRTSTVVLTGLKTPMGSGKVAFRDSVRAAEFARMNPPPDDSGSNAGGCDGCCSGTGV